MLDSLRPNKSKAISKLTVTITAYSFDENSDVLYVETNWNVDGINTFNVGDLKRAIDAGRDQIVDNSLKVNEN